MMRVHSELCHIDENRVVVRISAYIKQESLGSALGEGKNVQDAEDNALFRLKARINEAKASSQLYKKNLADHEHTKHNALEVRESETKTIYAPDGKKVDNITLESKTEVNQTKLRTSVPDDWSEELASIDLELKRIGWSREDESIYLQRLNGVINRQKITKYSELNYLLQKLKTIQAGQDPRITKLEPDRSTLIEIGDEAIKTLNWDASMAKSFLQDKMNVNTRNYLKDAQLKEFNRLLQEKIDNK